jgi:hypothetical protein
MEDRLVTFETAELAKERGFSVYTQKVYVETLEHTVEMGRGGDCTFPYQAPRVLNSGKFDQWDVVHCKAPTQSLLQKWLRDKHYCYAYALPSYVGYSLKKKHYGEIAHLNKVRQLGDYFDEYEDALESILQEALKSIPIVKHS